VNPETSPPPCLTVISLAARRGERLLFRGLRLTLAPGQALWLRGRNGGGKTTLLRLLAGLGAPDAGEIERCEALFVGHANAMNDDLRAHEALRFAAALSGLEPDAAAVDAALARLGLARQRDAFVRTLSQGQRRRLALARLALPQTAPLWLLDEPFDALDDDGLFALQGLLAGHTQRGGSVLLASHQAPPDLMLDTLDLDDFAVAA